MTLDRPRADVVVPNRVGPRHAERIQDFDRHEADARPLIVVDEVAGMHQKVGPLGRDQPANLLKAPLIAAPRVLADTAEVRIG